MKCFVRFILIYMKGLWLAPLIPRTGRRSSCETSAKKKQYRQRVVTTRQRKIKFNNYGGK